MDEEKAIATAIKVLQKEADKINQEYWSTEIKQYRVELTEAIKILNNLLPSGGVTRKKWRRFGTNEKDLPPQVTLLG